MRSRSFPIVIAAFAFGLAAAAGRVRLEREASALGAIRNPAWLPRGDQLRTVSLGQRLLLSDFYWLKLVQYIGENYLGQGQRWEALYPLADLVTDLDPRHGYAYQISGSNLAGLARRYDEAERILQKGMKNLPDRWSLYFVHAVNKFLYEGDFATAARYARQAAEISKRPHLALLAANLSLVANQDEEYQSAEQFLVEALKQVDTPHLREELQHRLAKVRAYALLSRLERAQVEFTSAQGRRPRSLAELARAAGFPGPPADPAGGRIEYDPSTGTVRSSVLGPRTPLRVTP
jgi:tetratricopeptide (TPR) repeat protein